MLPKKIEPASGQESVWDYPRPPRLESSIKHILIVFNNTVIADSKNSQRILETSHPPVYYLPPEDIRMEYLKLNERQSFCEWKGKAEYYDLRVDNRTCENCAWYYSNPTPAFTAIKNYLAFYPSKMDACYINEEKVTPQPGDFYGGWITSDIVGPFKGGLGSWGW